MTCTDRQLTEAQRQAAFEQLRNAGARQVPRPFSGEATVDNLVDYLNREVFPVLKQTRAAVNEVYRPVLDNAPSGNPLRHFFSTLTTGGDPTSGRLKLDNADASAATTIRLSQLNAGLADVAPWLEVMNGSSTTPLGVVTLTHFNDPLRFARYDLNTMVDQGSYWDLGVTAIEASSTTPFVESDIVVLGFIPGVASNGTTIPPGSITPIADETFLGNVSGAPAPPVAIALSSLAGTGLTWDSAGNNLDVTAPFVPQGWDDVLAVDATSGANNPIVSIGQFLQLGAVGPTSLSAQIRSGDSPFRIHGGAQLTLAGDTNVVASALGGVFQASGTSGCTLTSGTSQILLGPSTIIRLTTGGTERLEIEATGGWQLGGLVGTAGQYMRSSGAGASPAWASIAIGELPAIADDTFLANISGGAAAPTAVALTTLAGAGLTGGADAVLAVGAGTLITVNANDVQVSAGAAESFLGNFTAGSAVADYRAGSSVAGTGLAYSAGGTLNVGAGSGITVNADDVQLSVIGANTFMGNFTGSPAVPAGTPGATVAGAGLTYTTGGILAVGAGSGMTVNANDVTLTTGVRGDINVVTPTDWQILAQAVGNNELANMAANSIKANPTGVSAIAQDVAVAADSVLARVGGNLVSHPWSTLAGVRLTYAAGVMDVDLAAAYAWTGVHSFTGSSHTVNVTGAANIDADAASHFATSVGDLEVETTDVAATLHLRARGGVAAGAGEIRIASAVVVEGSLLFRVTTGGVERIEIESDGAWQVDGSTGTAGQVLTTNGNAASPTWQSNGLIAVHSATAADASYTVTPPADATWFEWEMKGGGGGGGGADADTDAEACAGAGGGEGTMGRGWEPITSGNITGAIGAGGTAGSNTGGNGGNGGNSNWAYGVTSATCSGGSGGTGTAAGAGAGTATQMIATIGGAGGTDPGSATDRVFLPGQAGGNGIMYSNGTTEAQASASGGLGGGQGGGQGGVINSAAGTQGGENGIMGSGGGGGARIATGAATGAIGGVGGAGYLILKFYAGPVPTLSAIT